MADMVHRLVHGCIELLVGSSVRLHVLGDSGPSLLKARKGGTAFLVVRGQIRREDRDENLLVLLELLAQHIFQHSLAALLKIANGLNGYG